MADIELVIKIDEEYLKDIKERINSGCVDHEPWVAIANGKPLPKGHGKIVDLGKIDKDRIESDNPVIELTVNGEYIEAVSLDYLNNLPSIVEADMDKKRL